MDKIDLIIDALSVAQNSVWSKLNEKALAAARELQALQPVGVFEYDKENKVWEELTPNCEGVKLYALDKAKHD